MEWKINKNESKPRRKTESFEDLKIKEGECENKMNQNHTWYNDFRNY